MLLLIREYLLHCILGISVVSCTAHCHFASVSVITMSYAVAKYLVAGVNLLNTSFIYLQYSGHLVSEHAINWPPGE